MRTTILAALAALGLLAPATATASQLGDQMRAAHAAAAPFADHRAMRRAGWKPFGGAASLMGRHWYDPSNPDYVAGEAMDPSRFSNLLYAEIGGRQRLVSVAYNYRISDADPLPAGFAGGRDVWHVHDVGRFADAVSQGRPLLRWAAETFLAPEFEGDDGVTRDRLAMVHYWLIPNPDGQFASHNRALAYLQLGLPADWADGATKEAARGLALAGPDGCKVEIDAQAWMGGLSGGAKRRLHSACRQVVAHVRPRLGSKAEANAAGEAAWAAFDRVWRETVTPAQQYRIDAIVEDGPGLLCR